MRVAEFAMSSFDGGIGYSNSSHRLQSIFRKCRYPSYLMRVVPPREYSSVDLRNMLVPKTYEIKKVRSVVMNHSHHLDDVVSTTSSVEFKDGNSAKQNVNNEPGTAKKTTGVRRNDVNEIVCKIDDLSSSERKLDENDAKIIDGLFTEKKCVSRKITDCEQKSEKSFTTLKVEVVNEVRKKNNRHTDIPIDSGYTSNNTYLSSKNDIQSKDEQEENCHFYDYDNQKQYTDYVQNSSKPSLVNIKDVDDVKFIKMCKICHKAWPFDDFSWKNIPKTNRIKVISLIEHTVLNAEEADTISENKISI